MSGQACTIDVALESVDSRDVTDGLLDLPLAFGEVVPGSGFTRHLSVRNTTTLPFPFRWHQSAHPQVRRSRKVHIGSCGLYRLWICQIYDIAADLPGLVGIDCGCIRSLIYLEY